MNQLAIVLPAWKTDFLQCALESVRAQTDQRFTLYIADDGGPDRIARICDDFDDLGLIYHRFDENLGNTSLTRHWDRSVALSTEPWIWLFGDDDEMHPECVAKFYEILGNLKPEVSVIRFNTDVIDEASEIRKCNPSHPQSESASEFLFDRLLGHRKSYVTEYIFRRSTYSLRGGFPDYPAAWCADDAAWFSFAGNGPILTIPGPRVRWRSSRINITGANRSCQTEKLEAGRRFLNFIEKEVEPGDSGHSADEWSEARSIWFENQMRYLSPLTPSLIRAVIQANSQWNRPRIERAILAIIWTIKGHFREARRWLTKAKTKRSIKTPTC